MGLDRIIPSPRELRAKAIASIATCSGAPAPTAGKQHSRPVRDAETIEVAIAGMRRGATKTDTGAGRAGARLALFIDVRDHCQTDGLGVVRRGLPAFRSLLPAYS
jgi:hypothetical protein